VTELIERLQPIFQDVFDDPKLVLTPDASSRTIRGWDSLAHINLVVAIEGAFQIRFALAELKDLKNVGQMLDLMEAKLAVR
jgi:acyl carrier protein